MKKKIKKINKRGIAFAKKFNKAFPLNKGADDWAKAERLDIINYFLKELEKVKLHKYYDTH